MFSRSHCLVFIRLRKNLTNPSHFIDVCIAYYDNYHYHHYNYCQKDTTMARPIVTQELVDSACAAVLAVTQLRPKTSFRRNILKGSPARAVMIRCQ